MEMLRVEINGKEVADKVFDNLVSQIEKTAEEVCEMTGVENDTMKKAIVASYKDVAVQTVSGTIDVLVPLIVGKVLEGLKEILND